MKFQFDARNDDKSSQMAEMPIERYILIRQSLDDAAQALTDVNGGKEVHYKTHIGGNMYLQVNHPFKGVSIRQFRNIGDSECVNLIPQKNSGIFLRTREWNEFVKLDTKMSDIVPEISAALPCKDRMDHCNQECCPNGENRHWFGL